MPSMPDGEVGRRYGNTSGQAFSSVAAETLKPGGANTDSGEDTKAVDEVLQFADMLAELGSTGLKRTGGYVDEEFLPQLRGRKSIGVFKEMSENDPLVGAILFTITMLLRRVEWTVKPAGKSRKDAMAAKLVETSMEDMDHTWDEFITEVLSMLVFGWSWHEIVYKKREGPFNRQGPTSKYADGMIGWKRLPIRAQETWMRWVFDDSGDCKAMVQLAPPKYKTTLLPIERSLHFRFRSRKNNPEGMSLLRNAYRPWYFLKRIQEFEAIGVERDLAGLPMVKVPAEYLRAKKGTKQAEIVKSFEKMVKSIRRNEQEGLVFPAQYDQDTKQPLFDFQLVSSSGGRQFPTDPIIQRYEQRILMSVLADFIMVGHQSVGSYSLHTDKTGIFRSALNSIAQTIADTLNRQAVPKLMSVNGFRLEQLPEIVPTDVDSPDIAQLAQFMSSMAGMGVQWFPDPELEKFVRDAARLPQMDDEAEERQRQLAQRAQATQFLEATAEYLDVRNAVEQMALGQQPGQPQPGQQPGPMGAQGPQAQGPQGQQQAGGRMQGQGPQQAPQFGGRQ